eukprot:6142179-Prymnesium_polylepis.1
MHCSPRQQRVLAVLMFRYLDEKLLSHDELASTGRALSLSPLDLKRRILVKGKVRPPKKDVKRRLTKCTTSVPGSLGSRRRSACTLCAKRLSLLSPGTMSSASLSSRRTASLRSSAASTMSNEASPRHTGGVLLSRRCRWSEAKSIASDATLEDKAITFCFDDIDGTQSDGRWSADRDSSVRINFEEDTPAKVRNQAKEQAIARKALVKKDSRFDKSTDEYYASYLSVRSIPVSTFLGEALPAFAMPICSINEVRCFDQ